MQMGEEEWAIKEDNYLMMYVLYKLWTTRKLAQKLSKETTMQQMWKDRAHIHRMLVKEQSNGGNGKPWDRRGRREEGQEQIKEVARMAIVEEDCGQTHQHQRQRSISIRWSSNHTHGGLVGTVQLEKEKKINLKVQGLGEGKEFYISKE